MSAASPATPDPVAGRRWTWLASVRALVFLVGAVYTVSLLPGVREQPGYVVLLDGWANNAFSIGVVVLLAARGVRERQERTAWWVFAAAVGAYTCGSLAYYAHYQAMAEIPYPSWSDLGWISFYPLAYVALFLMLKQRVPRLNASMWLDGIITGLTAAALGVAFALGAALRATDGELSVVATSFAYPVADLLLLVLVAGALAVIGRGAGSTWYWTSGALALFAVTDTVYAFQIANDTYVDGGPLDLGWNLAFWCFALAAGRRSGAAGARRFEGGGVLVVPGVSAVLALALLYHGYLETGDPLAGTLALCAVVAALGRTVLTFRELRALAESRRQARTDELTGLPNRRRVYETLGAADVSLAAGSGTTLLMIDLDRFKEINDSLGHAAGDALLRQVGPRLSPLLRSGDLLARLGGDEFLVVCADLDQDGAVPLAERLRAALQLPFDFAALSLTIDASIGIAVGPEQGATGEELLQLADLAMYSAKQRRVGVSVFDELRDGRGRHRLEVVEQLRAALGRDELVLHYQPKLDLRTGSVDGVEALVRWQHPDRGLLPPDAFIDLAESFGLMGRLTVSVLELALWQSRRWADAGLELSVAVNVSPSNLVDLHFPEQVRALLAAHRLPPGALVLEVTESLLMEDRTRAVEVLGVLRDSGVGIAIDDYGTGYSSLAYLAELPVTELKLDRAFIGRMTRSPRDEAIVTSTLRLAHALGLLLVAEGAEDQATVDALGGLGCDLVQGYHLSRPLTAPALQEWLQSRSLLPGQRAPQTGPPATAGATG